MTLQGRYRLVGNCSALAFIQMSLLTTIGIEKEFARATRKDRVHCLVSVVALDRDSVAHAPRTLHLVIACRTCTVYTLPLARSK